MECIVGVPTKPCWCGERTNYLQELHERARPPVGKDDGYGVGMRGPCVDEVNTKPVDSCAEMWKRVCTRFEAPPVISIPPVRDERPRFRERDTLRPVRSRLLFGPTSVAESLLEVLQCRLRYMNLEGHNVGCRGREYYGGSATGRRLDAHRQEARRQEPCTAECSSDTHEPAARVNGDWCPCSFSIL